ncbi:hypothetical protein J4212_07930 [Candidatus Woesearchaeota archaeon]|nr:hypothetical protein [Candidatus Woesearchaeota archaeon]
MKFIDDMDKMGGFEASILGTSVIPEVVRRVDLLFPVKIRYHCSLLRKIGQAEEYVKLEVMGEESEKLIGMLLSGKLKFSFFSSIGKRLNQATKSMDPFCRNEIRRLKEFSGKKLLSSYKKIMDIYMHYYAVGGFTFIYESYLAEALIASLKGKMDSPEDFAFSYMDSKSKNYVSYMIEYEKALAKLSKNPSEKARKSILDDFYYIKSNFLDSKMLNDSIIMKDMQHLYGKKPHLHKKLSEAQMKNQLKKLPQKDKVMLEVLALSLPLRDMRKRLNQTGQFIMFRFFDEALRRKGIEKKRAIFLRMFWNEFGDLLKNPAKLEKRLIKRRSATLYFGNGKALYLPGIAIKKRKPVKNDVLKGVIASKGSAKGAARIILGQKDFHKFRKGDILISEATRPEFLPIMKKAAAIVTEEGGITSHAAIVSRELKVPCIVGVSHITSILKNGDKVEVDANTGTIKLLKK